MAWRLWRHLAAKFASPFLTGMGVFTAMLLMDQISRTVDQLSSAEGAMGVLWSLLLLTIPLLVYSAAMAFLLGVIGSLEQMKQDRETTSLFAAGVSPLALLPPFLAAGALTGAVVMAINLVLTPACLNTYAAHLAATARARVLTELAPGVFSRGIPGTVLLVGEVDRGSGGLSGVLMVRAGAREQDEMVLAPKGRLSSPSSASPQIDLTLEGGSIHPVGALGERYVAGGFERLDTSLLVSPSRAILQKNQALMAATLADLDRQLAEARAQGNTLAERKILLEKGRRWASGLPFLLFPLLLVPLLLSGRAMGKAAAFAASIVVFLGMFGLGTTALVMGERGVLSPAAASLLVPAVLAAAAAASLLPFTLRNSLLLRRKALR